MLNQDNPQQKVTYLLSEICNIVAETVKTATQEYSTSSDRLKILDLVYQSIPEDFILKIRALNKKDAISLTRAIMGTLRRAEIECHKFEAQALLSIDAISKDLKNSQLPPRDCFDSFFTQSSQPINFEEIEFIVGYFNTSKMSYIYDNRLIVGVAKPIKGRNYSVFQFVRNPYDGYKVVIRGGIPIIENERIVSTSNEGVYFAENSSEFFSFKGKALVFVLEN